MVTEHDDILLTEDGDDKVERGDFAIGDGRLDDCAIIFKLNTCALKSDPILSPNLIALMHSNKSSSDIKQTLSLHLNRDNKSPKKLDIKNGNIIIEL